MSLTKTDVNLIREALQPQFDIINAQIASLKVYVDKRFEQMYVYVNKRFEQVDSRFNELEEMIHQSNLELIQEIHEHHPTEKEFTDLEIRVRNLESNRLSEG